MVIFSFIVAAFTTYIGSVLAPRLGFIAYPSEDKAHIHPTPLLGGVGIVCGISAAIIARAFFRDVVSTEIMLFAVVTATALAVGLYDDYAAMSPVPKAIGMCIPSLSAAGILYVQGGTLAAAVSCAAAVLFFTNAVNLFDHADGTCAAVVCTILTITWLFTQNFLALYAAGAVAGFWVWNTPPARVFMGDAGSLVLGSWIAVLTVVKPVPHAYDVHVALIPCLWLILYDTFSVILLRAYRGTSIIIGGRDHVVHRFRRYGMSASGCVVGCTVATVLPAIFLYVWGSGAAYISSGAAAIALGAIDIYLARQQTPCD